MSANSSENSSPHNSMEGMQSPGAKRAMHLLFTIPDRFYDFCHMDQKTFFELADWIMANVSSQLSCDVSIEESLFMFFDIVARGNSFTDVAEDWRHDVKLAQSIFLNVLNALNVFHERKVDTEMCASMQKMTRQRWRGAKSMRPGRSRWNDPMNDPLIIGIDGTKRNGLPVGREEFQRALDALNYSIVAQDECF